MQAYEDTTAIPMAGSNMATELEHAGRQLVKLIPGAGVVSWSAYVIVGITLLYAFAVFGFATANLVVNTGECINPSDIAFVENACAHSSYNTSLVTFILSAIAAVAIVVTYIVNWIIQMQRNGADNLNGTSGLSRAQNLRRRADAAMANHFRTTDIHLFILAWFIHLTVVSAPLVNVVLKTSSITSSEFGSSMAVINMIFAALVLLYSTKVVTGMLEAPEEHKYMEKAESK